MEQGEPVGAQGRSSACSPGVCGGSADRGVICPPALRRPPVCGSQTCSLSNRSPIKGTQPAICQRRHLLKGQSKLRVCCRNRAGLKNLGSNCWNGASVFDWLFPGKNPWVDEVEECKRWKSRHGCAFVLVIKPYHISAHKSEFERERWQRLDGMRGVHSSHMHLRRYWTEKVSSGIKKYSSI